MQSRVSCVQCKSRGTVVFEDLVQAGTLYEYLLSGLHEEGIEMTRDKVKCKYLCDVLAKKKVKTRDGRSVEYPSNVENTFRRLFPTEYQFVREFNRDGREHENLIRELQRQESAFVIETVAADLVTRYPGMFAISLHDAIFSAERDIPKVLAAFEAGLNRINFRMNLKVAPEYLKAVS